MFRAVSRTAQFLLLAPPQAYLISRGFFVSQATFFFSRSFAFRASSQGIHSTRKMEDSISLLDSVYGPVESSDFPRPMPANEAGLCHDGHQRRYLWTDAFGVLSFLSIANRYEDEGKMLEAKTYNEAAEKLISVVHQCLGQPRSNKPEDAMQKDEDSPTGYVGLRIGKTSSRKITDYGMQYDGMYWHYVDKWLLALARAGRVQDGILIAKSCFPYFFDAGPDGTGRGGGIRWKLSVDAIPPESLTRARASDDTLTALIVFSILEAHRPMPDTPSLAEEIDMLRQALQGYKPRVTDDPLGWGLEALFDQYIEGQPRHDTLASLSSEALHPSHLSLPFRLYGAMIGARVGGQTLAPQDRVDQLEKMSLAHERKVHGKEEHSCINRVMLAMCLMCPGTLGHQPSDPTIAL